MTITVNKLPDGPVIQAMCQMPMDWAKEFPPALDQIIELRDTFEDCPKYYVIIDASTVAIGFSGVVHALGYMRVASARRRSDRPANLSLVGSGTIIQLASKALGQQQYGEYQVALYTSLDKALEIIRADIAAWSVPSAG